MTSAETFNLPLFPLGTVLFPGMPLALHLFEERYLRLMQDRADIDPVFGVVLTRLGREVGDQPEIHQVGTAARLVGGRERPDGRLDIVVEGTRRFRVVSGDWDKGYLTAAVRLVDEAVGDVYEASGLMSPVIAAYEDLSRRSNPSAEINLTLPTTGLDPTVVGYAVATGLAIHTWEHQGLLEEPTTVARLTRLRDILRRERRLLVATGIGGASVYPGAGFSPN